MSDCPDRFPTRDLAIKRALPERFFLTVLVVAAEQRDMKETPTVSLHEYDAAVASAYRRFFPDDPEKSAEFLEWRFRRNPHGVGKFAIAAWGDRVTGMIALSATRLRNVGWEPLAYQAMDTFVDASARGSGLFVKMGSVAQDPLALGSELLWGYPNANAAPGWYGRLGWTNFGKVPLLMRPLRSGFILRRVHPRLRALDFKLVGAGRAVGRDYDDGSQLAADFDPLWNRIAPSFGITVDRSGAWMRWRLFDRPGSGYRCVGMKSGDDLEALVVTKLAHKHGGRLLYVMEAISSPERSANLVRLLKSELGHAAEMGAEVALAWCPSTAPNYRAYRRAGFIPVPNRIRPIEINFGARALTTASSAAADPNARWYINRRCPRLSCAA